MCKTLRNTFVPVPLISLYFSNVLDMRELLTRFISDPIVSWKTAFGSPTVVWRIDKYFVVRLVAREGRGSVCNFRILRGCIHKWSCAIHLYIKPFRSLFFSAIYIINIVSFLCIGIVFFLLILSGTFFLSLLSIANIIYFTQIVTGLR